MLLSKTPAENLKGLLFHYKVLENNISNSIAIIDKPKSNETNAANFLLNFNFFIRNRITGSIIEDMAKAIRKGAK